MSKFILSCLFALSMPLFSFRMFIIFLLGLLIKHSSEAFWVMMYSEIRKKRIE